MKKLLEKITEINAKHWGMAIHIPTNYKARYDEYMADVESVINKYTKSNCDCKNTNESFLEFVCDNCGRAEK